MRMSWPVPAHRRAADGSVPGNAAGRTSSLQRRHKEGLRHGGGHTRADGGDIRLDKLHRVVDAQAGADHTAGRVEVKRDVRFVVNGGQVKKLRLDDIRNVRIDLHTQKDDAVHHQAREYIHCSDIELALLDIGRIYIGV